jgi:hypothetical protein
MTKATPRHEPSDNSDAHLLEGRFPKPASCGVGIERDEKETHHHLSRNGPPSVMLKAIGKRLRRPVKCYALSLTFKVLSRKR